MGVTPRRLLQSGTRNRPVLGKGHRVATDLIGRRHQPEPTVRLLDDHPGRRLEAWCASEGGFVNVGSLGRAPGHERDAVEIRRQGPTRDHTGHRERIGPRRRGSVATVGFRMATVCRGCPVGDGSASPPLLPLSGTGLPAKMRGMIHGAQGSVKRERHRQRAEGAIGVRADPGTPPPPSGGSPAS